MKAVEFRGNQAASSGRLRTVILTSGALIPGVVTPLSQKFQPAMMEEDKRRLVEYYHKLGHLEARVRDYVARGMDPAAARAAALERFGDLNGVRRQCTEPLKEDRRAAHALGEGGGAAGNVRAQGVFRLRPVFGIDGRVRPVGGMGGAGGLGLRFGGG